MEEPCTRIIPNIGGPGLMHSLVDAHLLHIPFFSLRDLQIFCIFYFSIFTHVHCVSKKRHPFYICYNLIRCHPILSILGRNILQEIWNKHKCTENHTSFRVFVLYRVKSTNDFYGIQ